MILKTEAELERYNLVNRVFHLDKNTYLFGNLECNVAQPFDAINRDIESSFLKWDIDRIHDVIVRMANQGKFIQNQRYVDAFQQVFADPQFQRKAGIVSNDSLILEELVKRGWWPCTTEYVSQCAIDLWPSLADNSTFRENQAETNKRNSQIAEMTGGNQHGFSIQRGPRKTAYDKSGRVHDPMQGQAQGLSLGISGPWSRGAGSKPFSEMTNQEVQVLYDAWKVSSDLRNMTREELREIVKNKSNPYGTKPTLQLPNVAAPDGQLLINPSTQREFTQRELIAYLNNPNDPYAGRKLLTNPNTGRLIPWKKERFEKIIRGELG